MKGNVLVKLEVLAPYGGGLDTYIRLTSSLIESIVSCDFFTVNRSPHGNKTAREQFKSVGTKCYAIIRLDDISNIDALLEYFDYTGPMQGIDNKYLQPTISYNIEYSLKV